MDAKGQAKRLVIIGKNSLYAIFVNIRFFDMGCYGEIEGIGFLGGKKNHPDHKGLVMGINANKCPEWFS